MTERAQEVRSLVDAGAASPEELRALAAKLQEQRVLEESAWKREVKPALIASKKLKLRDLRTPSEGDGSTATFALALFALVAVMLVIATQTTFLWLLVPVIAVLVYAWRQGNAPEP